MEKYQVCFFLVKNQCVKDVLLESKIMHFEKDL